jgi:hypothetical protein
MTVVHALPPLDIELVKDQEALGLPPIVPWLVVPRLTDKPQDPILETIKRETTVCQPVRILQRRPEPHSKLQSHDEPNVRQGNKDDMFWIGAAKDDTGNNVRTKHQFLPPKQPFTISHPLPQGQIMSWDALRQRRVSQHHGTPFLSEQQDFTLAATRYQ